MMTAEGEKKLTPEVSPYQAVLGALLETKGELPEAQTDAVLAALKKAGYKFAVARVQWRR